MTDLAPLPNDDGLLHKTQQQFLPGSTDIGLIEDLRLIKAVDLQRLLRSILLISLPPR